MATALVNSHFRLANGSSNGNVDDYEQKGSRQSELDGNKSIDDKNQMLQCSFCQESQPSSQRLRDHLMLCGNKTDQCPTCRKFIRRAIFAYHYENSCANLEESDTPTLQPSNTPAYRSSSTTSKSAAPKENNPVDDNQENNRDFTTVPHRTDRMDRIPSATSNNRSSLDIKECKYCKQRCARSDYKAHKKSCLQNPSNITERQQRNSLILDRTESRPSTSESHRPRETVRIPCEICNEQIDFDSWTTHTKDCREREVRRIAARAETISREPVTEESLCEHCAKLYPLYRLQIHERSCDKNPENIARAARLANTLPSRTFALQSGLSNIERDPSVSSTYSSLPSSYASAYNRSTPTQDILDRIRDQEYNTASKSDRLSSHVTLHIEPTQERSRSRERDVSTLAVIGHQPLKRQTESDSVGLALTNSSFDVPAYDSRPLLTNDHLSGGTQSLLHRYGSVRSLTRIFERQSEAPRPLPARPKSSSGSTYRSQSASRSSCDARGSVPPQATKATSYLREDSVLFHSPRDEDTTHRPVLKQSDRPTTGSARSSSRSGYVNHPKPWK